MVLGPLYVYAFYATVALFYILIGIREISPNINDLVPQADFFGWSSSGPKNVLLGMIWTNVVVNYLAGMVLWLLWILARIMTRILTRRTEA
jgi:hypothetical protein